MASTSTSFAWTLSPREIASYRRDGYLVPRQRFAGQELRELQAFSDQLVNDNASLLGHPLPGAHLRRPASSGMICDGRLIAFAMHPGILDLIEQIAGPDIILWHSSLFHKPPEIGPPTPFHQDAAYWPIDPPATTTAWIAVRDSKWENACLRLVPMNKIRSVESGHVTHNLEQVEGQGPFDRIADSGAFDEQDVVDVELKAGQMVLFDCQIVHGASANTGTLARTGYSIRYMPSTSRFDHGEVVEPDETGPSGLPRHLLNAFSQTPLIVVRGVNRNCGNDLDRNQEMRGDR